MSDDYKTGFKNPPKKSQFKKGQSGNPKGRPPKTRMIERHSMETVRRAYIDRLHETITVSKDGKKFQMRKVDALLDALFAKASKGDHRSLKLVLEVYHQAVDENEKKHFALIEALGEHEMAWNHEAMRQVREEGMSDLEKRETERLLGIKIPESSRT